MRKLLVQRALNSPFGFQLMCLTFLLFFLLSFRPPYFSQLQSFEDFGASESKNFLQVLEPGFLENSVGVDTAGLRQILVEDADGKRVIMKKRDNTMYYTVKTGDNVSKIAHKFGLKISTILWANDINAKQSLQVGDKLKIPPTDGVYYKVQNNDTLGEIAKAHSVDISKIRAYNALKKDVVKVDQELFVPGAQRVYVASKPKFAGSNYNPTYGRAGSSTSQGIESIGFRLIRPTRGVLTQGYKRGHYAIDIANKRNTPIYASAGGTIKLARSGGWNYGYGTYLIIDHGNGVETLYAHNQVLKVREGDTVKSGQLVALMGNSGRVFGATGIHLHFELRIRGRKVNPFNYFQ